MRMWKSLVGVAGAVLVLGGVIAPAASADATVCTPKPLKYSWSSSLYEYCTSPYNSYVHIDSNRWNTQGNPAPQTVAWIPNSKVCKLNAANPILWIETPYKSDPPHFLTQAEWAATGYKPWQYCSF